MDYLFEIILLIIAVIPSILTYRIKRQITHEFDRKLEEYKQQLEENNIAFGTLHPKRVEAAEVMFSMIQDIIQKDKELTCFGITKGQQEYLRMFKVLSDAVGEFSLLVPKYRIYLSQEEDQKVSALLKHWMMELFKWQAKLKNYIDRGAFQEAVRDADIAFLISSLETNPQIEAVENMVKKIVGIK